MQTICISEHTIALILKAFHLVALATLMTMAPRKRHHMFVLPVPRRADINVAYFAGEGIILEIEPSAS